MWIESGSVSINRRGVELCDFLLHIGKNTARGAESSGLAFNLDIAHGREVIAVNEILYRVLIPSLLTDVINTAASVATSC